MVTETTADDDGIAAAYTTTADTEDDPEMVVLPEVGPVERDEYIPIPGNRWPETLRARNTTDSFTGTRIEHRTILLGLDNRGRAVYMDTTQDSATLWYVVPKHHRMFNAADDASIIYEIPPRHAPQGHAPVNGPHGDVLTIVRKESLDNGRYDHDSRFLREVLGLARAENWAYLSEYVTEKVESALNNPHPHPCIIPEAFSEAMVNELSG